MSLTEGNDVANSDAHDWSFRAECIKVNAGRHVFLLHHTPVLSVGKLGRDGEAEGSRSLGSDTSWKVRMRRLSIM